MIEATIHSEMLTNKKSVMASFISVVTLCLFTALKLDDFHAALDPLTQL